MSNDSKSIVNLFGSATRKRGIGNEKLVPKGGRTTSEEAEYFHKVYEKRDETAEEREKQAPKMVDTFYDLVTDFYESGWGQSFHFAPRGKYESFRESILRHEYYLASKLKMDASDHVLDCGMGIGGPMRNMALFTRARITGITINEYQVKRATTLNKNAGLSKLCTPKEMNFLNMTFKDNTFDKVFSIEATCHAGNRVEVFSEIFRVMKPGGLYGTYEWVMTDKYDAKNSKHVKIRQQIEKGNALPQLITANECRQQLKDAGFDILCEEDLACDKFEGSSEQRPWYETLQSGCSIENFPQSRVALFMTHMFCWGMEKIGLAPKGTVRTHEILVEARDGLVAGGELEIFTPMLLFVARKPMPDKE